MAGGIAELLTLFDLEQIEVNIFRGRTLDQPLPRVFGGQVAAQALVAAGRTVENGRVHSLHSYFLLPGDPTIPILYEVDRIRDGRSFTTRRVVAIQNGRAIFNLASSFHNDEEGLSHQRPMPNVPAPEELIPLSDDLVANPNEVVGSFMIIDGLDLRFITGPPWEQSEAQQRDQQLWLRTTTRVGDDPLLHAAFLTYVSDLTLVGTILKWHGHTPWDGEFIGASLDHCMWFHRPSRIDDWLLYDQTSPASYGARGLAIGSIFDRAGNLVASVAQEGLIRIRERR